ncbi:proteasome stabiliser-domain-containing protein [Xylogone sp. PMI_703]|nr:proteasome stabiliser-domain-containing protein [Xylogone sp. PMI_703]
MSSSEARELELVEKVEMRIALAKDDKLESILKVYLPPLLLKLASDHASVRNKVISTCQHIKVRLSGNQNVILPVAGLLKQYKENPTSSMIRHFDLMFVQQSIGKLSSNEQIELLPTLLHGIAEDSDKPTCATIFNLFLRLLPQLRIPPRGSKEDENLRQKLGLDSRSNDAKFVALWFAKLMIFTLVRPHTPGVTCPGLTVQEYEFLTLNGKTETWDSSSSDGLNLTETKIRVLNFLASGAFTDEERFLAALYAAGDTNSKISSIGDDLLKRSTVSLEDRERAQNLFSIYSTVKPALQIRILTLLAKSAASTAFPSEVVRIAQEGIQPNDNTNIPVKGLESIKFRTALFNYLNWVSRVGSKDDLAQAAPQLVSFLKSYIEDQGWPTPHDRSSDATTLRALAYETLGSLAKTTPSISLEKNLSLVRWLFRSITEEGSSQSIFISIDGALASLLNVFLPPLEPEIKDELRKLLLHYVNLEEGNDIKRDARYAAVRWANQCLEYSDIVGRWIDIIAVGSSGNTPGGVKEEGDKGLDPYTYRNLNLSKVAVEFALPKWEELVNVFFASQSLMEDSHYSNSMKTGMEIDGISVFGNFSGTKINAFGAAVEYCETILIMGAFENSKSPLSAEQDWPGKIRLMKKDMSSRQTLRDHLRVMNQQALQIYLCAAFEGLLRQEVNFNQTCGECFIGIASIAPRGSLSQLASRAVELLPAIRSNQVQIRNLAAQAFGILCAHPDSSTDAIRNLIKSLLNDVKDWQDAYGAEANKVHGSILALGFLLSRISYYGRVDALNYSEIQKAISVLLDILKEVREASVRQAVLNAIGQISAAGVLTATLLNNSDLKPSGLIELLVKEAKSGDEAAISALGRLVLVLSGDDTDDTTKELVTSIYDCLYSLYELRNVDVQFSVGEALTFASAGWESDALRLTLDVDSDFDGHTERSGRLERLVQKLLQDCKTTKPALMRASGIWLFCLVQYCGHLPEIKARLRESQGAFMNLLSAREELVQETASRGLSLVYERGDKELRDRLVKDLVSSFTGTTAQLKVDEETELFEPGALPTGEGKSVTSYKDIVSLAAEVGDQSLVYKFMSLASNAATWKTRAAFGRFGLSNILSESEIDPKLYPKLYRYRFDPNPNVQRSMDDIWKALVKDTNATINQYFNEILTDLLKSILGKEWRTRQASCAALADLLQGRDFEKYEARLHDIWECSFKVLDDIKGSVREAAMALVMTLTGILVRQLEAGSSSKHAQAMLKEVLPFLLSPQGMESSAKEVQTFATVTVLKLIKSGGKSLLPFVPDLVEQLLGLLSTMEMEGVDYLYLRAAHYNLTEEKIDNARTSAVSQSPLMEAIERCLDLLDEPTMKELVPHLENVIKTTVGMPSKVGCAGVLISLATRHTFVFRPHADTFLKILEKAVLDRNNAVSAAYARAGGYLARLGSDKAILRLSEYSKNLYFLAEDEGRRQISSDLIYAVSKFATDRFNSLASEFLPFVFFAKHDSDTHVKDQFEKTWSENVGGSRAVLLYSREINDISLQHLESPKWTIKHTAALTIADVVASSGTEIKAADALAVWPALEKALALKTFDGKEKVLDAFVKLTKASKPFWESNPSIASQMKKIVIREAKRNNDTYRPHAFTCLGEYSETRTDIDMFEEVYDIIAPKVEEITNEDKMDTTDDSKGNASTDDSTITAGITAIFRSVNISRSDLDPTKHLPKVLGITKTILTSTKSSATTRLAYYERSKALFEGLRKAVGSQQGASYGLALELFELLELPSGSGSETVRTKRGEAAGAIALATVEGLFGVSGSDREACLKKMKDLLEEGMKNERSPGVKSALASAMKILN